MDHLYGVISRIWFGLSRAGRNLLAFLLPILLMFACSSSYALTYRITSVSATNTGHDLAVKSAAANQHLVGRQWESVVVPWTYIQSVYTLGTTHVSGGATFTTDGFGSPTSSQINVRYTSSLGGSQYFYVTIGLTSTSQSCPAGQTRNASTGLCETPCTPASAGQPVGNCGCQAGLSVVGGICAAPCVAGEVTSSGYYDIGIRPEISSSMRVACSGSCEVVLTGDISSRALVGGEYHYYMHGEYQKTGGTCSGGDTAGSSSSDVPDDTCPAGWMTLVQNGQNICYSPDTGTTNDPNPEPAAPTPQTSTKSTTTTDNGDGTTTTTETTTGADGSTTTTTRTCDSAGNCTESTTTTPGTGSGSGGESGQDESDDPLDSYCEDNPKAQICKEESERQWSGDCGGWQCEGDAIDCAAAKAVWEMRCDSKSQDDTISYVADAMTNDGSMPAGLKAQLSEDVEIGTLDTSGFLGGGSCPADLSFTVVDSTFVLPISDVCPWLEMFGYGILVLAGLVSARIITGVV